MTDEAILKNKPDHRWEKMLSELGDNSPIFTILRVNPQVVLPYKIDRATTQALGFNYQGLARLKPGVTLAQANADVGRLMPTLIDRFPMPPGFTILIA